MTRSQNFAFNTNLVHGTLPDSPEFLLERQNILNGLKFQPAGTAFITGVDGRDYAYVFPTLFFTDPQLPGLEYIRSGNGPFELSRTLPDLSLGSVRDFAVISDASSGVASFVIVDHGSEYRLGYESWPFGHVWVATDRGDGFSFEQISDFRAFNHAVSVGDLNRDGLIDIVSSHMGVKSGGVHDDLHLYLQQADGSFTQDRSFAQSINRSWGSGAVAVANLDQTPEPEVIQVNYLHHEGNPDWGAIRILSSNDVGQYYVKSVLPREGLFKSMGATRVVPFDYNLNGHLDLIVSFEGAYGNLPGIHTGNGLEIYENNGQGEFTRVTDALMERNAWSISELQFREFEVVDFDGDGYPDIILNGWHGTQTNDGRDWNLASQMFRNLGGTQFVQLSEAGATGLIIPELAETTVYIRVVDSFKSGPELFIMQRDGAPASVTIDPLYRNASEKLTVSGVGTKVKGYGGDDFFDVQGVDVVIDGGEGSNTVSYALNFSEITISSENDKWFINRPGVSVDTLNRIERLQFADINLALDTDGVAGEAYRIYKAAFDRAPDATGLGYWINVMDNGASLTGVAGGFIGSDEFQSRYGDANDVGFIKLLYENVLDRQPDAGGYAFWQEAMGRGLTREGLLVEFSESRENKANVEGLIANGIEYTPFIS